MFSSFIFHLLLSSSFISHSSSPFFHSFYPLHSCHSAINWTSCTALTWETCLTSLRHALLCKPRDRNSSQSVMLTPSYRDDLIRSTHRSEGVQGQPVRYALVVNCVLSCPVLSCPVLSCTVLSCPVLSSCSIFPCILYSLFLSSRQYFSDFVFLLHIRNSSPLVFFLSSIFFLPLLNFLTITTILPFFPPLLSHNSISFITCLPSFLFSLHFFPPFISFLPAYLLSLHFISPFISFHFSLTSDGF